MILSKNKNFVRKAASVASVFAISSVLLASAGSAQAANAEYVVDSTPLTVGKTPISVDMDHSTGIVYTANTTSDDVSAIEGGVVKNIPVGTKPTKVAVLQSADTAYVINSTTNDLSIIKGTSAATTIPLGGATKPTGIAIDQKTGLVYITNFATNNVSIVDGTNFVTNVPVGNGPGPIAVDSTTGTAYAVNQTDQTVSIIRNKAVVVTPATGKKPVAVAVNEKTGTAYVVNETDTTLSVFVGINAPSTISGLGATPVAVGVNSITGTVYVANNGDNTVSVVKGQAVDSTIPNVGTNPLAISVDEENDTVYVSCPTSDQVAVIRPDVALQLLTTPVIAPSALVTDSATHTTYVAHPGMVSGSVSVIHQKVSPTIVTANKPPAAKINEAYFFTFSAAGFPAPSFSTTSVLPKGLQLNSAGELFGTPLESGTFNIVVKADNGVTADAGAEATFSFVVDAASSQAGLPKTGVDFAPLFPVAALAFLIAIVGVLGMRMKKDLRGSN